MIRAIALQSLFLSSHMIGRFVARGGPSHGNWWTVVTGKWELNRKRYPKGDASVLPSTRRGPSAILAATDGYDETGIARRVGEHFALGGDVETEVLRREP